MADLAQEANPYTGTVSQGFRLRDGMQSMISTVTCAVGDCMAVSKGVVATSLLYSTMVPVATGTEANVLVTGMVGLAVDAITVAGGTGRFLFIGVGTANMAAATALGADLSATTGVRTLTASATTQKVVASCLVATGAAGLTTVMFDGINGFGNRA